LVSARPSRTATGRLTAIGASFAVWLMAAAAAAQQAQLGLPPPPFYTGDAIEISVTAVGFEEEPTPTVELRPPANARLEFAGVHPNVSTSIVVAGGQIRRTKEVKFVFAYRIFVDRPGTVDLGPVRVTQAGVVATTQPARFSVQPVPTNDRVSVELELPEAPVYVGERVPVTLRFVLRGTLRENLHRYTLRVPFFDLTETFQFLDPAGVGQTDVKVITAVGELDLKGEVREEQQGGEGVLRVSLQRTAVPLRPGSLEIPPAILDVEEGVNFRRDLFGGRQATRIRKWRAQDSPRRLLVKQIPVAHTPPSFAGAVGAGFALVVSADRSVVQVGEPITLSLELQGDGNLATASLPPLDSEGLLPPGQFRVPGGELTGVVEGTVKRFTAVVRVLDEAVREIPALEYAWFDPATEQFQTTRSRPIALSVRAAQLIGAAQVESRESPPAADPGDPGAAAAPLATRAALVLTGADLAIERDPGRLLQVGSAGAGGRWAVAGLYAVTLLVLAGATLDRRRRNVDPAVLARRKRVRDQLQRVRAAAEQPAATATAELASALRQLRAELLEADSPELDALLGECDARSYAPAGQRDDSPLDAAFHARALALAEALTREAT
jgi:hypothetical protein